MPHIIKDKLSYTPRTGLFNLILVRIDEEKVKKAKRIFAIFALASIGSMAAFVTALEYAIRSFTASEFSQYFSLLFSDGSSVIAYWKQFSLLLAESFPLLSIAILLATALITLVSLKNLLKNFGKMSYSIT